MSNCHLTAADSTWKTSRPFEGDKETGLLLQRMHYIFYFFTVVRLLFLFSCQLLIHWRSSEVPSEAPAVGSAETPDAEVEQVAAPEDKAPATETTRADGLSLTQLVKKGSITTEAPLMSTPSLVTTDSGVIYISFIRRV